MSASTDKQIAEILARYDEPLAGNVWRVQGTAVIYHKALERIAAHAKIRFDLPTIVRAERDEAVIQVVGRIAINGEERMEWSIGEALIGTNYRVSGKQAAYVYAMAEKRAKDRVILKLIGLHGLLYSEDEADEFRPTRETRRQTSADAGEPTGSDDGGSEVPEDPAVIEAALIGRIAKATSINAVTDLMLEPETQRQLACLLPGIRDMVRKKAKDRLVSLGWARNGRRQEAAE